MHRTKILFEAARALIGLEQFAAAEEVLEQVLQAASDGSEAQLCNDAQLYLAIAKINHDDIHGAEHQLRNILRLHEGNAMASMILGYVYRLLWYLDWKKDPNPPERAKASPRLLMESIYTFGSVHRLHPEEYLSGYNALLLVAVADKLFGDELKVPIAVMDRAEMTAVVRYTARSRRQIAEEKGDYDQQFWTAVALTGLELIDGNKDAAIQIIRDACAVPSATLFNLRWLEERLKFLDLLKFEQKTVEAAQEIVRSTLLSKLPSKKYKRVIVFHSYPIDRPGTTKVLFPRHIKDRVQSEMTRVITDWNIGEGDLAICAACTECDIFFGQTCLDRGARLRVLLFEPTDAELSEEMRDPNFGDWTEQRSSLLNRVTRDNGANEKESDVWYHRDELGVAVHPCSLQDRHNRWMLETARVEAEHATSETGPRLYGLALSDDSLSAGKSDGSRNAHKPEGSSFFVAEIRGSIRYQGVARVIDLHRIANDNA